MRTYVDPDSTRDSLAVPTDSPPASGAALLNGGFPEPPPGAPVRIVRADHNACGTSTRVRLPSQLPAAAVRRVVCQGCAQPYDAARVEELELIEPPSGPRRPSGPARPGWLRNPHSRAFQVLALVVGAAAVIAALALIQGSGDSGEPSAGTPAKASASAGAGGGGSGNEPRDGAADLIRGSSFSLALPPGWQRTNPPSGATFAAAAPGNGADATLWVRRDPELAFADFQANSLERLRSLAGSAEVVDQVAGPSAGDTIVTLAAEAPPGSPQYEVTLRASGPYRYYLATTVQSEAGSAASEGVDLIQGSFVPTGAGT
jgi:hypothetical protein